MTDAPAKKRPKRRSAFAERATADAARKLKVRRHPPQPAWFGLGMMGLVGWSVVVPTLLGAALGHWLDAGHADPHAWTLALLLAGLTLGCANAWHWVSKEERAMRESDDGDA